MKWVLVLLTGISAACAREYPVVSAADMLGEFRIASTIGRPARVDGLVLQLDGGFRHCWPADGGVETEFGRWSIDADARRSWVALAGVTDTRSLVPTGRRVEKHGLVSRAHDRLQIELDPDVSDYFVKQDAASHVCVHEGQ